MIHTTTNLENNQVHFNQSNTDTLNLQAKKHLERIAKNYQNNLESDYTETIDALRQHFVYSENSNQNWTRPEFSMFYGTPLYDVASPQQKLAFNHLTWALRYGFTRIAEAETIHYNQITGDALATQGEAYRLIAEQLKHEADQEQVHIRTFDQVGQATMAAIDHEQAYANLQKNFYRLSSRSTKFANVQEQIVQALPRIFLSDRSPSPYLAALSDTDKSQLIRPKGFISGRGKVPQSLVQFFMVNWGRSPFLACQYFTIRYFANLLLKVYEHPVSSYYSNLQRQGALIPVPTAISHYHFLDESFHTTTSLFLARDLYKDLPKPTAYEKFVANSFLYLIQRHNLSGISGVYKTSFFGTSLYLIVGLYRLLQNPTFGLSSQEAAHWLEKCFCHEHEGFHLAEQCRQRVRTDLRRLTEKLDYLWPVNREMQLMADDRSISKAIAHNRRLFWLFSNLLSRGLLK
ncbi:MAG: hypothetical protein Kow00121_59100 [Elainellaceae cyanobacterium]